ncbi:MAG: hypothetical protein DLM72_03215 [Candidatus Nitrosopolaris wilkensis]|nr:MAG: hypothetical protein DLM72_03215 [Candidatus Nitrosopolaris wilkensis]
MLGFTTLLILSTVIVNSAAAQQPTKTTGIKITSPAKGQPVSLAGNDLKISGIASHNGTLACKVYVIVNDMKPYQRALPTGGHNNTNDYSTWVFNLVPTYTTIKPGTNKITSKLACQENNANTSNSSTLLTKFYSINVTGAPTSTMKQQGQSIKNSSNTKVGNNSLNATKTQSGIEKKHSPISNNTTKTSGSIPTNSQQLNSKMTKTIATKTIATKTIATKTNATKTSAIPINGANNNNNANVTGQTGKGSQQANQPSQMTSVSAAALLSTAGILSTHQGDAQTSGTTNANIDHGHLKGTTSKYSSGPTTTTKTNDNSLNNKGSAESGKQQNNTSTNTKADNNNAKSLSVSMHIAKRPVHVGDKENLTLGVTDSNRTHVVAGASVFGSITDPSGISKKLAGTTNEKGKVAYSWQVSGDNTSGKYKVVMETSAPGYQNNSVSKTFTVVPIPITSSNNSSSASSNLRNVNNNNNVNINNNVNNNNVTTSKQIASPPPTVTPSVIVATSSTTKSNNNHNSPLISSKQNSTHLALQSSVSNQSGRVYIPSTTSTTLSNPTVPPIANSFRSFESGRVSIPNPGHNINIPAISSKVNVPNPQTNSTKSPVNQGISPIQKPLLPNNNDKIPFVIATPLLHITNGTSMPASNQLSSTMALDLVDRMRVIGFDSGMFGPASGVSVSSTATSIPQKNTVFIPTAK